MKLTANEIFVVDVRYEANIAVRSAVMVYFIVYWVAWSVNQS